MRLVLFLMLCLVAVPIAADSTVEQLIVILQEYKIATAQLETGLTELQAGLDISKAALQNSIVQTQNLKLSFEDYKTAAEETTRKLRIGIFAIGAGCIISLFLAIIF